MKYFSASVLGIAASAILTTSVSAASGSALEHPNAYSATQTAQTPIDFSSNATGDVLFSADSLTHHKELGVIVASGNVEASYNGEVLMADQISYDQKNDSITAKGNITFLQKNGDVIFADFLEVSTDFARGAGKNIRLILSDDSRAAAAELVRTGNRDTVLKKVVYSPCKPCEEDPTRPLVWQLKAEEVRHDQKQQRFEYKDASLEFFGVPVFYTPYFAHPEPNKKRETGFLAPSYGNESDLGLFVSAPFYYNIAPEADATVTPTYYPKENQLLMAGEYRRNTANGSYELDGSGTYISSDNKEGGTKAGEEEFRGHIAGKGKFDLDETWRWGFDGTHVSDDTYLRRYNFDSSATALKNQLFIEGFRHKNYAAVTAYNYSDLTNGTGNTDAPSLLLDGRFNHMGTPSKTGAYWSFDSSILSIARSESHETFRLGSKLSWDLPYTAPSGEVYQLTASVLAAGYFTDGTSDPETAENFNGFSGRVIPQVSMEWRYPLARKHGSVTEVLEPIVGVYVAPNIGSNWKIPNEDSGDLQFDISSLFSANKYPGIDQVSGGTHFDYGVKWSAQGASGGSSHIYLGQSYRLRKDASVPVNSGLEENFSDVVGQAGISPNQFIDFLYRARFSQEDLAPIQSDAEISAGPESLRLGVDYRFIDSSADSGNYGDREEVSFSLNSKITQFWSGNAYATRRLSAPKGMQTLGGGLTYLDDCFQFDARFDRSYYRDRDIEPNDTIAFRLTFKNLGALGL